MSNYRGWLFHQPLDVHDDVLHRHRRDFALTPQLRVDILAEFGSRQIRQIVLVAQKVVDDQHPRRVDRFLDRFESTKRLLIEREGQRLSRFYWSTLLVRDLLKVWFHDVIEALIISSISLLCVLAKLGNACAGAGLGNFVSDTIAQQTSQPPSKCGTPTRRDAVWHEKHSMPRTFQLICYLRELRDVVRDCDRLTANPRKDS